MPTRRGSTGLKDGPAGADVPGVGIPSVRAALLRGLALAVLVPAAA
ncbi:hypothetical protein GTR02_22180, partial [Kineococcus sp. R8]|nr:hypothetical protein [Kineococcus siccus]